MSGAMTFLRMNPATLAVVVMLASVMIPAGDAAAQVFVSFVAEAKPLSWGMDAVREA